MTDPLDQVLSGLCADPRGVLGPLDLGRAPTADDAARASRNATCSVRVFRPDAVRVEVTGADGGWLPLDRVREEGVFEGPADGAHADDYRLRILLEDGETHTVDDPYRFPPTLTVDRLEALATGRETRLHDLLGARLETRDGVAGVRFAVWAPRALSVGVMASFNGWQGRRHPMFPIAGTGVWELFVPDVEAGALYKFQIRVPHPDDPKRTVALEKADPLGRRMEVRPNTASVVTSASSYAWNDDAWVEARSDRTREGRPISIYEVHLGSWRRSEDGGWLGYSALAEMLLPYVKTLGFTHVELLPITEHPHDASWGYQTVGYFALTSRYGDADEFRSFVDEAHRLGLGVLLDWVPAHFPKDAHGLACFDGRPLYEHEDPRRGAHPDWGTAIFDYGRPEVASFLVSSARFWIEEFHVDGLRVDAVASMLYLDYSREEGEWAPNQLGGRENLEAIAFLKQLTGALHQAFPGVLLCAEDSSEWGGVTRPADEGGLGFDLKWNMGWMNDTLEVFDADPYRRPALHQRLTWSIHYAHHERHLLPLSHDEVVHLKRSLLSKMPGGYDAKFAGLRLLFGYMWTHPGAKLLFMGGELGEWAEWDEAGELDWDVLAHSPHAGVQRWVAALNRAYIDEPALHALDHWTEGFEWIDVHDAAHSTLTFLRWDREWEGALVVVANFSAAAWPRYRVAVPAPGRYRVVLDSDRPEFGGRDRVRPRGPAIETELHGRPAALGLYLPPLSIAILRRDATDRSTEAPPDRE